MMEGQREHSEKRRQQRPSETFGEERSINLMKCGVVEMLE